MFERFRSRSGHADAPRHVHASDTQANHELQDWQSERAQVVALLDAARSAPITPDGLMIHRGEGCCGILEHCLLIEERREAGHYAGGSTGVSIPIGSLAGRSVRYRVGANRGHYVQGALSPTAIASIVGKMSVLTAPVPISIIPPK